jgi:cytochrome b
MIKSYIWPLTNRLSHILLIVFFVVSYILSYFSNLLSYHVAFGYALGVVFAFRTIWGFIGPEHSKFKDFNFRLQDLKEYMVSVFSKTKEYVGHNPASSYAVTAMIVVAFLTILTGALAYGIQENHGVLSFLHDKYYKDIGTLKDIHGLFSNIFLAIVGAHMCGALIDKFIKRSDAIDSMISGYKKTVEKVNIKTSIFQRSFSIIWIVASLFTLSYLVFTKDTIFTASANVKQNYEKQNALFSNECGSCHITYPPYLLPKKSWVLMMNDLENHFGDDASLDTADNLSILAFLTKNSAEKSTHQASLGILKSLRDDNGTIAITKTTFWKRKHRNMEDSVFTSTEVKTKGNCKACHIDIQNGLLENDLISTKHLKGFL